MGYESLMSTGDERIEVRGMRDPPLRFGNRLTGELDTAATCHNERDRGRGMVESRPFPHMPGYQTLRSANFPWEPDRNA